MAMVKSVLVDWSITPQPREPARWADAKLSGQRTNKEISSLG